MAAGFGAFSTYQFWPLIHKHLPTDSANSTSGRSVSLGAAFGRPDSVSHRAPQASSNPVAPQTAGDLVLVASSPGGKSTEGTAQLGTDPANPQTYTSGALLLNGSRLTHIFADHVILERDGRSAELYLYWARRTARAESSPLLHIDAPIVRPQVAASDTPTASSASSAADLTDYIRPNPVFAGEQLRGFELRAGSKPLAFSQLGLVAGDVVVAVDGVSAADPAGMADLFQQLMTGRGLQVTVERRGKLEQLVLDGSVITAAQRSVSESAPAE